MYLFFDTETTGLPKNWKAPVTDVDNWPRMIQIAWLLCNESGEMIEEKEFIIFPEGFEIPEEASKVHRICTQKAREEGESLEHVLKLFNKAVSKSQAIVAHNISFDEKVLGAELLRKNVESSFESTKKICTMHASTDFCKIPGKYGYKWPKLSELHTTLFGKDFEEAHNALADIRATERCFWELKKRGVIGDETLKLF